MQRPGKEGKLERVEDNWSRGVTVSTLDSEPSDRGSNPRGRGLGLRVYGLGFRVGLGVQGMTVCVLGLTR